MKPDHTSELQTAGSGSPHSAIRNPQSPFSPRPYIAAALLTALTFVGLPYLELLSHPPSRTLRITEINTTHLPPPPPPTLDRPEPRKEPAKPKLPKPQLVEKRKMVPLNAVLNLGLATGNDGWGDLGLSFSLTPDNLVQQIGEMIFDVADLDEAPQPLVQLRPMYPPRARMRRIQGVVQLEFIVDIDGRTRDITILSSQPGTLFNKSAIRAIARWRFKPGTKEGKPVAVRVKQTIRFQLEE